MPAQLLALAFNIFDSTCPTFRTFDAVTGALIADYSYPDPPLQGPPYLYPFAQRQSDNAVLSTGNPSASNQNLLTFDADLNYVSADILPNPAMPPIGGTATNAPWLYADRTGRLFGVWFNEPVNPPPGEVQDTVLVQLDPLTFAQTTLWDQWAPSFPDPGDRPQTFVADLSQDGDTLFYTLGGVIGKVIADADAHALRALDIPSGVSTVFAAIPGVGWAPEGGTKYVSTGLNGQVFMVWVHAGGQMRIIVYEANGAVTLDLDLSATFSAGFAYVAPLDDGSSFWVLGQTGTGTWNLNLYALPLGGLLITTVVPGAGFDPLDVQYFQLAIIDIGVSITGEGGLIERAALLGPGTGISSGGPFTPPPGCVVTFPVGDI